MKHENLLVLGGTGACGRWVVKLAKERGHDVTAIVRSASKLQSEEGVHVIEGSVLDADTVDRAMVGQDAVLSCLGIKRKTPNPWAAVVPPTDLTSHSACNIVDAMKNQNVQRVVAISSAGVGDSWGQVSPVMRFLVRRSNISVSFQDMAEMENVYKQKGIDSLCVRPVGLVNKDQSNKSIGIVPRFGLLNQIGRRDVAEWMLDAIERPEPFKNSTEMIGWT